MVWGQYHVAKHHDKAWELCAGWGCWSEPCWSPWRSGTSSSVWTGDDSLSTAIRTTPGYLRDVFLRFDLGFTDGRPCGKPDSLHPTFPLCGAYSPGSVAGMLRERAVVDVSLLAVGALIGLLLGVLGGRFTPPTPAPAGPGSCTS